MQETTTNNEGIKFQSVDIHNFKGISAKSVEIFGKSLVIIGGNGKDKSSFIQVLKAAMDSSFMPDTPLTAGQDNGNFKVVVAGEINGNPKQYTIEYFFTKKNGKGKIVVTNADGEPVKSPATVIKALVGDVSYDVFKFIDMTKSKQVEVLKKLTGKYVELDTIAITKKEKNATKLSKMQEVTFFEKTVAEEKAKYTDEEIDKYAIKKEQELIDTQAKMDALDADLTKYNARKNGVTLRTDKNKSIVEIEVPAIETTIAAHQKAIKELEEKIKAEEEKKLVLENLHKQNIEDIATVNKWLETNEEPKVKAISDELEAIRAHNGHYDIIQELMKKQLKAIEMKKEIEVLATAIDKCDTDRDKIITTSDLGIEGLTFTDDEVLYKGLPFSDLQLNKAKLIEIGMQIGMRLNPKLKCVWIGDGSLLDRDSLKTVVKIAEDAGYQIIIEMVKYDGGEMSVEFAEEFLK